MKEGKKERRKEGKKERRKEQRLEHVSMKVTEKKAKRFLIRLPTFSRTVEESMHLHFQDTIAKLVVQSISCSENFTQSGYTVYKRFQEILLWTLL